MSVQLTKAVLANASPTHLWDTGDVWLIYVHDADGQRKWNPETFADGQESALRAHVSLFRSLRTCKEVLCQRGPKEWAGHPVSRERPQRPDPQPVDSFCRIS